MSDWPQAGANAQRTAFQASETMLTTFSVAWRYQFAVTPSPIETIDPNMQVIVSDGHVLVATLMGHLYSFAAGAAGGAVQWTASIGAPIVSTPATDGTNVYVADMLGRLSAWRLSDGAPVWGPLQVTDGEWAAFTGHVLLDSGMLMIGGPDRKFRFIDPADGTDAFAPLAVGGRILQGAAGDSAGLAVVGCSDGKVRGFDTSTGTLAWETLLPNAGGFQSYHPVIVGSKVVVRPQVRYPFWQNGVPTALQNPTRGIMTANFLDATAQNTLLAAYDASPSSYVRSLFVLTKASGADTPSNQIMHWYWPICLDGYGHSPPCVDKDGYLVLGCEKPSTGGWTGGTAFWGRVDLSTRKWVDILTAGTVFPSGNRDENVAVSSCSNGIALLHIMETNAQVTGFVDQTAGNALRTFSSGAGTTRLQTAVEGAANPGVLSGGLVYHLAHPHTLVAWQAV